VLLSLFNLPTLANVAPKNLIVLIFDNQVYSGTRISEPSATAGKTDLARMAQGAGIEQALTVRDLQTFESKLNETLEGDQLQFVRYLERTEGRTIFRSRG
jgi:thiamine pyrophosphate-dependent acetolactate synthase large subunit-like protein